MRRGKEIAQGAHGSIAFLSHAVQEHLDQNAAIKLTDAQRAWISGAFAKVTVQVPNEQELLEVYNRAREAGLTTYLITDSGRTEFGGKPTNTVVAIGPDESDKIDEITGKLSLY
jgi:PTH2 family peptidyl-tRNA hydrolase